MSRLDDYQTMAPADHCEPKAAAHQAWWLWTLGQAAILALYAGRVKMTGGYPEPVEATADLGVACGQMILATLLGPALLAGRDRLWHAAAAGLVFTVLAAVLAERPTTDTLRLLAVAALWLVALARLTRSALGRLIATGLTVTGPILFYASLEYAARPPALGSWPTLLSPTLGVCTTRFHSALFRPAAVPFVIILVCSTGAIRRKIAAARHSNDCSIRNVD